MDDLFWKTSQWKKDCQKWNGLNEEIHLQISLCGKRDERNKQTKRQIREKRARARTHTQQFRTLSVDFILDAHTKWNKHCKMKYNMFFFNSFCSFGSLLGARMRIAACSFAWIVVLFAKHTQKTSAKTKCRYRKWFTFILENSNYPNGLLLVHNVLPFLVQFCLVQFFLIRHLIGTESMKPWW